MSGGRITFMKGVKFVSSVIDVAGYDVLKKRLGIRFRDGSTYVYDGVSSSCWREMQAAQSIGSFFGSQIKSVHAYSCVTVEFRTIRNLDGTAMVEFKVEDYLMTEDALSEAWF